MYYVDVESPSVFIKVIGISSDELSNTLRIVYQQSDDGEYYDINEELFDERFDSATKNDFYRSLRISRIGRNEATPTVDRPHVI